MVIVPVEPKITEYLHNKAALAKLPLNGTFELTPVCNMDCKMCYVRMSREQQEAIRPLHTTQEWIELGRQAKERGMLYLLLTGGEPFLRKDLREILEAFNQMGLVVSINSNATLIDESVIEWLKKTPPTRINITLYGANDETYARLCGNPKGYTQVTKAIRLLKEAGISVKINCSLTPYNAADLEGIMSYCQENGLICQATAYMFPSLRKNEEMFGKNASRFTPEEASYYAAKIESLMNGEDAFLERMKHLDLPDLSMNTDDCMDTEGEGILCRAGKCSFWVTWDGRFMPCGMFVGGDVPNVFEEGFDLAWQRAIQYAEGIRLPAKCKDCQLKEVCYVCAAMVYCETGTFDTVPEYRCRMAHSYKDACLKVEAEILEKRKKEENPD